MSVLRARQPASDLSTEELVQALGEYQRALFEIDVQIDAWEAEATPVSDARRPGEAMHDPHSAKLIRTRKEAAASLEEIDREFRRRKNK